MTADKQTCPHCRQVRGIEIIYGSIDALSEAFRVAVKNGDVVLGGASPKWDWEEELINTRCLQCQHEWHGEHKDWRHAQNRLHPHSHRSNASRGDNVLTSPSDFMSAC